MGLLPPTSGQQFEGLLSVQCVKVCLCRPDDTGVFGGSDGCRCVCSRNVSAGIEAGGVV